MVKKQVFSDPSEELSYIICHRPGPFLLVWSLHEVPIFLYIACVRTDDRVCVSWLDRDFYRVDVPDCSLLSSLDYCYS